MGANRTHVYFYIYIYIYFCISLAATHGPMIHRLAIHTQDKPAPSISGFVPTPVRSTKPSAAPGCNGPLPARLETPPAPGTIDLDASESEASEEYEPSIAPSTPQATIPYVNDPKAKKPTPGELQLSRAAIASRMRRVFTPTLKGQLKVSQQIMEDWHAGPRSKKRQQLEQIFQLCGYDAEHWHTSAKIIDVTNDNIYI